MPHEDDTRGDEPWRNIEKWLEWLDGWINGHARQIAREYARQLSQEQQNDLRDHLVETAEQLIPRMSYSQSRRYRDPNGNERPFRSFPRPHVIHAFMRYEARRWGERQPARVKRGPVATNGSVSDADIKGIVDRVVDAINIPDPHVKEEVAKEWEEFKDNIVKLDGRVKSIEARVEREDEMRFWDDEN